MSEPRGGPAQAAPGGTGDGSGAAPAEPSGSPQELEAALRGALSGTRFASVRWVGRTGSTNADLVEEARRGTAVPAVLLAEAQTAGRGRLGRVWQAPPGSSLLLSVLDRPPLTPREAHLTTTAVAVAAAEAVESLAGLAPGLKWPNDLVVEDGRRGSGTRKLGGVLAESVVEGDRLGAVVVGIGLNVAWPEELPPELEGIATSLRHEVGRAIDRVELAAALLRGADAHLAALDEDDGRRRLLDGYRRRCTTLGRDVRVEVAGGEVLGRAVGIDGDGHLEVVDDEGRRRVVAVGDVVHLRPREP